MKMNYETFVSDLKNYEHMKNQEITLDDYDNCVSNWEDIGNNFDDSTDPHFQDSWDQFICWCSENWK